MTDIPFGPEESESITEKLHSASSLPIYAAPSQDDLFDVLRQRSKWHPLGQIVSHVGPAIYVIRLDGEQPIDRWLGRDECRVLYIGSSGVGKGGLRVRSRQIERLQHAVPKRMKSLANRFEAINGHPMCCELSFIPAENNRRAAFWESLLLHSYYLCFGDQPPLNRKLEHCYIKKHGNTHDSVISWSLIKAYFEK